MNGDRHGPESKECREIFARLSEYIDDEMEQTFRSVFENHLGDCAPCETFLASLRQTVRALEDVGAATLPDEIRREVVEAFHRLKKDGA